ncbi:MAG: penicillin-binding protein 2 [Rhodospirillales bacterium]|nr:penicillin-binding protein 2 [Rhodospirillales bacterium]
MEHVRLTAPDLARRAAMEKTRGRLVVAAAGFALLFTAVALKLADATVIDPLRPPPVVAMRRPDPPPPPGSLTSLVAANVDLGRPASRATIEDRNGQILAISLPTASVFANPHEIFDPAGAARALKSVLPDLDEALTTKRLADQSHQFVYIARQITPRQELRINALGIPGVDFEHTERRRYPLGRTAAQVLGGVDVDGHGVAGVERFFDARLRRDPQPLRLALDVRVQAVVRDELSRAMDEFQAIGACGIVMDVRTGEVIAMVSLPDYDANDVGHASPDERFNRAVTGMYEPGSTFKLQTASMALNDNVVHIWNGFDASSPIHIGRFTITDFEGKHRWLYLPEILAYSSNIGAAKMAEAVGAHRQQAWLYRMGMLSRLGIELPEAGMPLVPPLSNWKEIATLTIGFGHGIAVSPLHIVTGTAAVANGGTLFRPTILAQDSESAPRQGFRVMRPDTSDIMRKLMRLVVTDGYGKPADVPGYFVGGKTGTAEKASKHGYHKHANVSAFMSAFPMNAPHYAVYMMLDDPKGNAATHGYSTGGWVSAPAAGRVIARIGPMLGLLPQLDNAAEIQASLAIPLEPGVPPGATGSLPPRGLVPLVTRAANPPPPVVSAFPPHDYRHQASLVTPAIALH